MGRSRILILAVAAVSAAALAFIVRGLAAKPTPSAPVVVAAAPAAKPMAKVLVAKHDLAIGARLTPDDLQWQSWPADAVNPAFITDGSVAVPQPVATTTGEKADALVQAAATTAETAKETLLNEVDAPIAALTGAVVKEAVFANEPITDRKLVRSGQSGYMAVVLQPGMRALAIGVSVESGAGGFILPGDRVDIIQSRAGANGGGHVTDTVMTNVRVLAIDQATAAAADAKAVVGAVATLELTPGDAEFITLAKSQGDLTLALRSYADAGGPTGRRARPVAVAAAGPPAPIRVWRNGQATAVSN
jgi:pilus assembly protein CpaB